MGSSATSSTRSGHSVYGSASGTSPLPGSISLGSLSLTPTISNTGSSSLRRHASSTGSTMSQRQAARFGVVSEFTDLSLHRACANGDVGLVKYALTHGQPVNSVISGVLPLHCAASSGNDTVVRMLIEAGADVNAPRLSRRHTHNHIKTSGLAIGTAGSTALHFAAANNRLSTIALLLSFGARAGATEKHGLTPEGIALQKGFDQAADLLRSAPGPSLARRSSAGGHSMTSSGSQQARRRPSLPALMERAAHSGPAASLHAAIGRVRRDSDAMRPPVAEESSTMAAADDSEEEMDARRARRRSADLAVRPPRATSKGRDDVPQSAPAHRASFAASDISRASSVIGPTASSGPSSLAQSFYRPRQSSQLSGRTYASTSSLGGPVSPRVFLDDDEDMAIEDEYASEGQDSSRGAGSEAGPGTSFRRGPSLLRSAFDPRHARQESNTSSVPSYNSGTTHDPVSTTDNSDNSTPNSLAGTAITGLAPAHAAPPVKLRGFVNRARANSIESAGTNSSSASLARPTSAGTGAATVEASLGARLPAPVPAAVTRSHRSDSAGTDARFSSSSATSSYSGPGTGSTYAPSNSTAISSVGPSSPNPQVTPLVSRGAAYLTPVYETGSSSAASKHSSSRSPGRSTTASDITTSAQARSKVKQAEQQLLAFDHRSLSSDGKSGGSGPSLAQQLAAYGQSLTLERALAAKEKEAASKNFHLETIGTSTRHLPPPSTPSTLTPEPSLAKLSSSASTLMGTTPTPVTAPAPISQPSWPPQDRVLRLVPPTATDKINGRRSASPLGTSGPTRRPEQRDPLAGGAPRANSISASSSTSSTTRHSTHLTVPAPTQATHQAPFDLVVVSPPSSSSGSAAKAPKEKEMKERNGSGSYKGAGSVTSAKDQVMLDAEEQKRIEAAIPRAVLTVPKKSKGLGGLFGRKK